MAYCSASCEVLVTSGKQSLALCFLLALLRFGRGTKQTMNMLQVCVSYDNDTPSHQQVLGLLSLLLCIFQCLLDFNVTLNFISIDQLCESGYLISFSFSSYSVHNP